MSNDVTLSASIRSNLLNMQNTSKLLDATQNRLSTGKKVNSALDDPNAFFAAQGLSNRGSDLSRLLDGMGQGIQALKAADTGITSLTKLVEQAQSIAQTARDETTVAARVTGTVEVTTAEAADLSATTGGLIATGDSFTLTAGGDTFTITQGADGTLQDIADDINALDGISATLVDGDTAGTQQLQISTTNGEDLVIAEDTNTPAAALGFTAGTITATGAPTNQARLEADYNKIMTQIDQMVQDTGYRGTNLLNGDNLKVQFNEDNSSSMEVEGVTYDSEGLGISAADFSDIDAVEAALGELTAGLSTLRDGARTFGGNLATLQTREEFTSSTINTLSEGADKLTLADMNEESAKMLALQTTQTLGITSLSLASQAQQGILRLF
jgi:flagellin-like hook-associated protein FlgL